MREERSRFVTTLLCMYCCSSAEISMSQSLLLDHHLRKLLIIHHTSLFGRLLRCGRRHSRGYRLPKKKWSPCSTSIALDSLSLSPLLPLSFSRVYLPVGLCVTCSLLTFPIMYAACIGVGLCMCVRETLFQSACCTRAHGRFVKQTWPSSV